MEAAFDYHVLASLESGARSPRRVSSSSSITAACASSTVVPVLPSSFLADASAELLETVALMQSQPTSATQAKDRHYMQLSHSLTRLSNAVGHTADLCELLKANLDSMRVLAASHAAQFMTVASQLNPEPADDDAEPHEST